MSERKTLQRKESEGKITKLFGSPRGAITSPRVIPEASPTKITQQSQNTSTTTAKQQHHQHQQREIDLVQEYERKITALADALQLKAEENMDLWNQLQTAKKKITELEANVNKVIREKGEALQLVERFKKEKLEDQGVIEEMNRRMHALSEAMTELAEDNVKLAQQKGVRNYTSALDAESVLGKRKRQQEMEEYKKQITTLETASNRANLHLKEMELKLKKEESQKQAYMDSNAMYEKKVMELEEKMQESLQKEAQRREAAELIAKRLKQRVKDLEFLVSELQDAEEADDDEEEEDEDEEEEEKKEEKQKQNSSDGGTK